MAGKPFLDYILDELSRYPTIQDIVLLAGHQAGQVIDRYGGRRWRGATVSVVSEPAPFGTGGALKVGGGGPLMPAGVLPNGAVLP